MALSSCIRMHLSWVTGASTTMATSCSGSDSEFTVVSQILISHVTDLSRNTVPLDGCLVRRSCGAVGLTALGCLRIMSVKLLNAFMEIIFELNISKLPYYIILKGISVQ